MKCLFFWVYRDGRGDSKDKIKTDNELEAQFEAKIR